MAEASKRDEDSFHIHRALNHPLRKRIIELLGEKGSMSFTDFKAALDVRVGTLYYHFDALSRLISQDAQKRYVLTPLGHRAYELSRSEEYRGPSHLTVPTAGGGVSAYLRNLFLPSGFFSYVYGTPKLGISLALLLIAFGSWISIQAKLDPVLFFFDRNPSSQQALIPIEFVGGWLAVFVVCDLMARGLFQRRGDDHLLLIGTAFSFAPVILFPVIGYVDLLFGLRLLTRDPTTARALLAVLQAWSIVILSYAISLSKGLRVDKAAIISLAVAYANIVLLFVLGRIG